jgi:hypothetical protein
VIFLDAATKEPLESIYQMTWGSKRMEGQINFEENSLEDVAMGWRREERRSAGCLERGERGWEV